MLRAILVGLDSSSSGEAAIDLGIEWARRFDALLVGMAVVDEPHLHRAEPVPLGGMAFKEQRDKALIEAAHQHANQLLGAFSQRCTAANVASKLLENTGLPSEQILIEAQRYDLILLGQHANFGIDPSTTDDTLQKVSRHMPRPLVVVPEGPPRGSSIVVAYDGSLPAARTLQIFQAMQLHKQSPVHVITVHNDRTEAARCAERAVEFLRFQGVTAHVHAIESTESPAQIILEQARVLDASLIVMGAHGHTAIREFFFGSVTRTLLDTSTIPIFLYH